MAHAETLQPVPQGALFVHRQPMRVAHCRCEQLCVHSFLGVGFGDLCQVANPVRVVVCPQPDSHDRTCSRMTVHQQVDRCEPLG